LTPTPELRRIHLHLPRLRLMSANEMLRAKARDHLCGKLAYELAKTGQKSSRTSNLLEGTVCPIQCFVLRPKVSLSLADLNEDAIISLASAAQGVRARGQRDVLQHRRANDGLGQRFRLRPCQQRLDAERGPGQHRTGIRLHLGQ
jgi:hypothetical protein